MSQEVVLTEEPRKGKAPSHKDRFPVWVDRAMRDELHQAAQEDGRPVAWLARDILADGLRRRKTARRRKPEDQ